MINKKLKVKFILTLFSVLITISNLLLINWGIINNCIEQRNTDNINTPQTPRISSIYYKNTTGEARDVYISGNYAYVADGDTGLAIINISDPTNPGTPIYEDTTGFAYDVHVDGDFAYVADVESGLAIINISDPTNPEILAYKDTTGLAVGVYVSGDYAYIADATSGLAVIDISDPTNPGTPYYEWTTGNARSVHVKGNYAYIADYNSGLAIIDVTDKTNPVLPIYVNTTGLAIDVHVSGNYAYVANDDSGLVIIDISVPFDPITKSNVDTSGYAYGVYASGNSAYVADYDTGIVTINISDPTNPGIPNYKATIGYAYDVYVAGDYAYIANYLSGLAIIEIQELVDFENPSIITAPSNFTVESGYKGQTLSWMATDTNPDTYTITLQGAGLVAGPIEWINGTSIIYDIPNGLIVGEYIYTINITDDYGQFITHNVKFTVQDTKDPIIMSETGNLTINYDYMGIYISWTATDPNPDIYTITLQDTGIVVGPTAWINGTAITYDIPDGLSIGEYLYTINFTDDYDNFVLGTIKITIQDVINPIITSNPSDFTIYSDYKGINISWTAFDSNPHIYTIELHDSGIVDGPSLWLSNTTIIYNVPNGLAIGEYMYTINFTDDYNNYVTDTVTMTIKEMIISEYGETISFGNYYLIFLVISMISLAYLYKRRVYYSKRTSDKPNV
ncbi:MAG: LVIVD repeat-containing protein [Candidatus Thorarchaeota archaeon]